jgi:hypothetical protein
MVEKVFKTPTDVVPPDVFHPGVLLVFPHGDGGDFGIIRGVSGDGHVTLASVTSRKKVIYSIAELQTVRPLVAVLEAPTRLPAVEAGAWYQDEAGKLYKAQGVGASGVEWITPEGSSVRLPLIPTLRLVYTPSVRVPEAGEDD